MTRKLIIRHQTLKKLWEWITKGEITLAVALLNAYQREWSQALLDEWIDELDFGTCLLDNSGLPVQNNWTPLQWACHRDSLELAETLLNAGAGINSIGGGKDTPLHTAASHSAQCTKLLIKAGAQVNATDEDGNTPLHNAAEQGNDNCAQLLLWAKADTALCNMDGETAADVAQNAGYFQLADTIVNRNPSKLAEYRLAFESGLFYLRNSDIAVSIPHNIGCDVTEICIHSEPAPQIPGIPHDKVISNMITLQPHGACFAKHLLIKFPVNILNVDYSSNINLMYSASGAGEETRWVNIKQHNTSNLHQDEMFWFVSQGHCYLFTSHFSCIFLHQTSTVPQQNVMFLSLSLYAKYVKDLIVTVGFHCHRCYPGLDKEKATEYGSLLASRLHCVYERQGPVNVQMSVTEGVQWQCDNPQQEISIDQLLPLCHLDKIYNITVHFRGAMHVLSDERVKVDANVIQGQTKSNMSIRPKMADLTKATMDVEVMTDLRSTTDDEQKTVLKSLSGESKLGLELGMNQAPYFDSLVSSQSDHRSKATAPTRKQQHSDMEQEQTEMLKPTVVMEPDQSMTLKLNVGMDQPHILTLKPNVVLGQEPAQKTESAFAEIQPLSILMPNLPDIRNNNQLQNSAGPTYNISNVFTVNYNQAQGNNLNELLAPETECVFNRSVLFEQKRLCEIIDDTSNCTQKQLCEIAKAAGDVNGNIDVKNLSAIKLLQLWKMRVQESGTTWRKLYDLLVTLKCDLVAKQLKLVYDKDCLVSNLRECKLNIELEEVYDNLIQGNVITDTEKKDIEREPHSKRMNYIVMDLLVNRPQNYERMEAFYQALYQAHCYKEYVKRFMLCPEHLK